MSSSHSSFRFWSSSISSSTGGCRPSQPCGTTLERKRTRRPGTPAKSYILCSQAVRRSSSSNCLLLSGQEICTYRWWWQHRLTRLGTYYYRARGLLSRPEAIRHTHYSTPAWHTKTTMLLLRYLGMWAEKTRCCFEARKAKLWFRTHSHTYLSKKKAVG